MATVSVLEKRLRALMQLRLPDTSTARMRFAFPLILITGVVGILATLTLQDPSFDAGAEPADPWSLKIGPRTIR